MTTHRIGLAGTGGIAHAHLAGYREVLGERAVVTAACDPRQDVLADFAAQYDVPHTFPDAASMIASGEVDAVVLLTPPAVRSEVIEPALAAGVAVLVEKPYATTGPEAVRYTEAAEQAGVPLAVGQNFRWFPEYQWLAGVADRLGEVYYLDARSFQDRPQPEGVWRAEERKLEMAIFSVHVIDRLQWLAPGVPVAVSAVTRRDPATRIEGEQFTTLTVQFSGDAVAQMTSTWRARALPSSDFRLDGTAGSALVHRPGPMDGDASGRLQLQGGAVETAEFPDPVDRRPGPATYGHGLKELLDAIDEGRAPSHSGRDNLRTMGIMEAAYLSAGRGGALVEVAEALGGDVLR